MLSIHYTSPTICNRESTNMQYMSQCIVISRTCTIGTCSSFPANQKCPLRMTRSLSWHIAEVMGRAHYVPPHRFPGHYSLPLRCNTRLFSISAIHSSTHNNLHGRSRSLYIIFLRLTHRARIPSPPSTFYKWRQTVFSSSLLQSAAD